MKKSLLFILTLFTISLQSQNKVESALAESFNGSSWDYNTGIDYTYDSNNNMIVQTEYSWNTSAWELDYKSTYTYNAANKVTQDLGQFWNGSQFVNYYRVLYTYNGSGLVNQILEQEWNQTQWDNVTKTDLTYNNNLPSVALTDVWDGSQWVNETRGTVTYAGALITLSLNESWDGTEWVNSTRNTWTYNANNKKTSSIYESWDESAWTPSFIINYDLDATGNRLRETYISAGEIESKIEYNYDTAAQLVNFAHPFKDRTGINYIFEDFPYVNKILGGINYSYNSDTSSYEFSTRTTLNYNNSVLNTNQSEISLIKLFPNPSSDYIQLSGVTNSEKISIYTILGTKVLEKTIDIDEKINIQSLSYGMYILKLDNGKTFNFLKK